MLHLTETKAVLNLCAYLSRILSSINLRIVLKQSTTKEKTFENKGTRKENLFHNVVINHQSWHQKRFVYFTHIPFSDVGYNFCCSKILHILLNLQKRNKKVEKLKITLKEKFINKKIL